MKHQILTAMMAQVILIGTASASEIVFHADQAVYAGNGCPQDSTSVSVDEFGDLYIDHTALGLVLPAQGENEALAGRKACTIRVPAFIPKGFYVKSIQQSLHYGVAKSVGADLQLATRAAFSSDTVRPFNVSLPTGFDVYSQYSLDTRLDQFVPSKQIVKYCGENRAEETMFQLNVVISGQRESVMEDLVAVDYGNHFGEGIEIELANCP